MAELECKGSKSILKNSLIDPYPIKRSIAHECHFLHGLMGSSQAELYNFAL